MNYPLPKNMEEFSIEEDEATARTTVASTLILKRRRTGGCNNGINLGDEDETPVGVQSMLDKFLLRFSRKACYLADRHTQGNG